MHESQQSSHASIFIVVSTDTAEFYDSFRSGGACIMCTKGSLATPMEYLRPTAASQHAEIGLGCIIRTAWNLRQPERLHVAENVKS